MCRGYTRTITMTERTTMKRRITSFGYLDGVLCKVRIIGLYLYRINGSGYEVIMRGGNLCLSVQRLQTGVHTTLIAVYHSQY